MAIIGTSVIVFDKPESAKRKHICKICSKAFKRSEHCARHQRGHTQERPYVCRFCPQSYKRRDLVVRHERTLHGNKQPPSQPVPDDQPSTKGKRQSLDLSEYLQNDAESERSNASIGNQTTQALPTDSNARKTLLKRSERSIRHGDGGFPGDKSSNSAYPKSPDQSHESLHTAIPSDYETAHLRESSYSETTDHDTTRATYRCVQDPESTERRHQLDAAGYLMDIDFEMIFNDSVGIDTGPFSPIHRASPQYGCENAYLDISFQPVERRSSESSVSESSTASIPRVFLGPSQETPQMQISSQQRSMIIVDLLERLPSQESKVHRLPDAKSLSDYLEAYLTSFHVHLPIIHLPTLNLSNVSSPLIITICAIGALYRLERERASELFWIAESALRSETDKYKLVRRAPRWLNDPFQLAWDTPKLEKLQPLWASQCHLLLLIFCSLSGESDLIDKATRELGACLSEYRRRLPQVSVGGPEPDTWNWQEWAARESTKRLLYGYYFLNNFLVITYGLPPGLCITRDGSIEMPADQSLWDAPDQESWQSLEGYLAKSTPLSLRKAVSQIMCDSGQSDVPETCWTWSPFACSVVVNAVVIHLWHVAQTHFSGMACDPRREASSSRYLQMKVALSRCESLIKQGRTQDECTWNDESGPLFFNCLALIRASYCFSFAPAPLLDQTVLLKDDDSTEIDASIEEFISAPQKRGHYVTMAMTVAFEGLVVPYRAGPLRVKRTAALTWAIEHALAGWTTAILLSKWLHTMEILQWCQYEHRHHCDRTYSAPNSHPITPNEQNLLKCIKLHLEENTTSPSPRPSSSSSATTTSQPTLHEPHPSTTDTKAEAIAAEDMFSTAQCSRSQSLASKLMYEWASYFDDTWVWGITPRMAWGMRRLAKGYQDFHFQSQSQS